MKQFRCCYRGAGEGQVTGTRSSRALARYPSSFIRVVVALQVVVVVLASLGGNRLAFASDCSIDVGESLQFSVNTDSVTVRANTSDSSIVSVSKTSLALADGGWNATFSVTGESEGVVTVSLSDVFDGVTYAAYEVRVQHSFDEGVLASVADCVNEGVVTYTCTRCGATKSESLGRDPSNHVGSPVVVNAREAACCDGYTGDTACSACGQVIAYGETIPALYPDHVPVVDAAVEPTCTEGGLTSGSHCSVCGEVLEAQRPIEAKGHVPVADSAVEATEDEPGLTEGSHCSVCGEILVPQQVIPVAFTSLTHGVVSESIDISSTCQIEGDVYIAYGKTLTTSGNVTINGDVYAFGDLTNTGTLVVNGTLHALHYGTFMSAGDFDFSYVNNYGKMKCATINLKADYLDVSIPAAEHEWGDDLVTKEATCTDDGSLERTCRVCGMTQVVAIPALGHTWADQYTIDEPPTCIAAGMESLRCAVCGETKPDSQREVPAHGHSWSEVEFVAPTYDSTGVRTSSCTSCGQTKTDVLPVLERSSLSGAVVTGLSKQVYTGKALKPVPTVVMDGRTLSLGDDYTLAYEDNVDAGIAKVTITGKGKYDGTRAATFEISKAANGVKASAVKATQALTYKTSAQSLAASKVFAVTGANGAVTYAKKSGNAGITVSAAGKVTAKKGLAAGTYKCVFSVKAAGDVNHGVATKAVTVVFKISKAANPMVAKSVARTASYAKVRKASVSLACPVAVSKARGKVTYAKVAKGSSSVLAVNKTTGRVTVKKGAKRGTYTIKVKVTAAGDANHKAANKTITCKIKVK